MLTNPDKLFFPRDGFIKKDIVSYYFLMADFILPYIKNRPFVMKRYPEGIEAEAFYQKEIPSYAPEWIHKVSIYHNDKNKTINYPVITDINSLLWLVNLGALELHSWLSKVEKLEKPDIMIIDLDPQPPATFLDCLRVATLIRKALLELGLDAWPKTSGATGVHLFIPINTRYSFRETTLATKNLFQVIHQVYPQKVTLEHLIAKRTGKIYLDYLQNIRGRTMAFPYSIRPIAGAPVSTPLLWKEVEEGLINPADFNIQSIWRRVKRHGDIMKGMFDKSYNLETLLNLSSKH